MRARLFTFCMLLIALLLQTGCATLESSLAREGVLGQYSEAQLRSSAQLEYELKALEKSYHRYPTDYSRVRLAVVLGFGACGKCDRARALKLFNETVQSGRDASMITLASIFSELLEARTRAVTHSVQLQQQRQHIDALQQKLDALTSIEESLHARE